MNEEPINRRPNIGIITQLIFLFFPPHEYYNRWLLLFSIVTISYYVQLYRWTQSLSFYFLIYRKAWQSFRRKQVSHGCDKVTNAWILAHPEYLFYLVEAISSHITSCRRMVKTTNHPKNKCMNWYTGSFEWYTNTV